MKDYRLTLKLLAPLGTPLQSDTLFGHLCWQAAYGGWPGGAEAFLQPFRDREPPFVLSDGFPSGYLPRPLAWHTQQEASQVLADYAQSKRLGRARFVTEGDFLRLCRGDAPWETHRWTAEPWQSSQMLHAAIDRNTGTTSGTGNLYLTSGQLPRVGTRAVVYVRCRPEVLEPLTGLLRRVAETGYGKDKSVGMGAFQVEAVEPWDQFAPPEGANGFVVLSSFTPKAGDPTEGFYRLRTKYGRLSEIVPSGNPYKRPLLQIEPGACFRTEGPPQPFYGRLVTGVAPGDDRAVQCGYTLAVAAKM